MTGVGFAFRSCVTGEDRDMKISLILIGLFGRYCDIGTVAAAATLPGDTKDTNFGICEIASKGYLKVS